MIVVLLSSLLFGIINYVRGRGLIPKAEHVIAPAAWASIICLAASILGYSAAYVIAMTIVTFLGMLVWLIGLWPGYGGWGRYFASWKWTWTPEPEVPPIDWAGLKLAPLVTPDYHWTNGLRGTICMALRGLYITPLFFMFDALPLGIAVGLSQGIVYGAMHWLAPADRGTEYAEPIYAFIIGMALGCHILGGMS